MATRKASAKKATVKKATVRKATVNKATVEKATVKKAPARKAPARKVAAEKAPAARKPPVTPVARRADFGAPIDGFFAKQPPALRALLEELRALVEEVAPDATASIKWGMPFYAYGKQMMCALGAHKAHVNLILSGPTGTFDDPDGLLEGEAKIGRHLKLQPGDTVPHGAVRGWVRAAAERARGLAR